MECLVKIIQRAGDQFLLQFRTLKKKLEEGMVFTEYEQIPKKKANGVFSTAALPENAERSRIREVVPYEENRVELIPTKENNTGYINASHIKVRSGGWRGVCWEGWLKIAGLTAKGQGGENIRAATVHLGLSPNRKGVFLNSCALLSQLEGHAYHCTERRKPSGLREKTSGQLFLKLAHYRGFNFFFSLCVVTLPKTHR